jgi:ribonuclease HII
MFPKLKFGDSKKLSARQREAAINFISEFAIDIKVEIVPVEDINRQGIGWANRAAFERLVMAVEAEKYIVDGNLKLTNLGKRAHKVHCMVDADVTEQCVSAASIVAKVTRDRIMHQLHDDFPMYGWNHNMGYGTAQHIFAIREYGPTAHHRNKFVTTALSKSRPKLPGLNTDNIDNSNPSETRDSNEGNPTP